MSEIMDNDLYEQWYSEAESMTLDKLPAFITHLLEDYEHNYDTIVYALTAGTLATTNAMDRHNVAGITGFQASCVMWEFIRHWMNMNNPMMLQDLNNLLYPQYEDDFTTISKKTWKWVQQKAREKLEESPNADVKVRQHWESIINGNIPFGLKLNGDE